MLIYYEAAEVWPGPASFYRLREPLLWYGSGFLYRVFGSRVLTFLVIDIVAGVIILRAMAILDDGDNRMFSFGPTIIASYVFLLGQQNVLRQHLGFAIFLWALAARSRRQRMSPVLYALSFLTHNVTALLFGVWMDAGRRRSTRRYGTLITLVGVGTIGVILPLIRKSASVTGIDTVYLYVVIATAILGLIIYANLGRLCREGCAAATNYMAFIPAIGLLTSAQFERISMMFLVLMLIETYRDCRQMKIKGFEVGQVAYGILVVPVFLFRSTLSMLQ